MLDIARSQQIEIDIDALSKRLGCPVIPMVSTRSEGICALKRAIDMPPVCAVEALVDYPHYC